jgi:hypothetical protein
MLSAGVLRMPRHAAFDMLRAGSVTASGWFAIWGAESSGLLGCGQFVV